VRAFCSRRAASLGGLFIWVLVSLTLAGCATNRMIDSSVRSFNTATADLPLEGPFSFRFDRLPSQQADAQTQERLEEMALPVLAQKGLVPDTLGPRFTLELRMAVEAINQSGPFHAYWGFGTIGSGLWSQPGSMGLEPTRYRYTVHLLLRDAANKTVVFESTATHEGPWSDRAAVLPAVLLAALQDFPQGSDTARRVLIDLSPGGMQPRP
jgi:hypothetical protein